MALRWHHVRERTLLIEEVFGGEGELRGQKTGKPPADRRPPPAAEAGPGRAPLYARAGPSQSELVFPRTDDWWLKSDWRNWRRRVWRVTTNALGMDGVRPYDLRHSFASLLIHEGRLSIVEIAQQLGHNPNTCLSTYAHVMAELRGSEKVSANEQIRDARERVFANRYGPKAAHEPEWTTNAPLVWLYERKPGVGLEPTTPSLPWKCSTELSYPGAGASALTLAISLASSSSTSTS